MSAVSTTFTTRQVAFRGGTVKVVEAGQGPTVGYLHGMVGLPAGELQPMLAELAADHRVIAPCLPGFTGSSYQEGLRVLSDWVVALSELVDLCGLTGAPLVASSVGAMVALELAAVRPEAFSHLVLLAPMGLWDAEDPVADAFGTTMTEQRALLTADPAATARFWDDDPAVTDAAEKIELGVSRYLTRTSAASLVWPSPEHGFAERAHLVRTPTSLVWGTADRLVPPSYADRFGAVLPQVAGRYLVNEAGHLVDWDRPVEVAAIVRTALG
ncbi:MAG: alpha/beta hydrolase [Acidimicrobiales bacterium]